jgi:hypothetical protein
VGSREYFINGAIWGIAAILLAWGVSTGTLSWRDAALIAAVVAWPFAVFYCFRVSGMVGLLMKLYALAPLVALVAMYFRLFDLRNLGLNLGLW